MVLYIKNMVCHRCKMAVTAEFLKLHLHPLSVQLGEVAIEEKELSAQQTSQLANSLQRLGFELIDDKQSVLINRMKALIIDIVHHRDEQPNIKFSQLIAQHLHHDYSYLSNLFSSVEGITIEQFIINQKIEKVKELILYNQLSLSQIAYELGYSSTAHLSNQFKKLTGLTPSAFKLMGAQQRKPLDEVGSKN